MLSFLSSLTVSSEDARRSFCRGEPKADSPNDANAQWTPYVRHWKKMFEHASFAGVIPKGSDRGRLGWLKDASYWKAYWSSFDTQCKRVDFAENDGLRMSMVSKCVGEAAAMGNMAFFQHVKSALARQTVSDCLHICDHAIAPSALAWVATVEKRADFDPKDVVDKQSQIWCVLQWFDTKGRSPLFSATGQPKDLDVFDATLVDAFSRYGLNREQQINAIGHILTHCPSHWLHSEFPGDTIVERLKARVSPLLASGVDIDTIALCCGQGPNSSKAIKDIKIMGKLLSTGHTNAGKRRQQSPELAMLSSLYTLSSPLALYEAVHTSGLLQGKMPEVFSLPEMELGL